MQTPVLVRYRGLRASEDVGGAVREQALRLQPFAEHIASCRVEVERWDRHQRQGAHYRVALEIASPHDDQEPVEVERQSQLGAALDVVPQLLRDAFAAAERALLRALEAQPIRHSAASLEAKRLHALHGRAAGEGPAPHLYEDG